MKDIEPDGSRPVDDEANGTSEHSASVPQQPRSQRRRSVESRPDYRPFGTALGDDEDFHALSGLAAKLLVILRLDLSAAGIGKVYLSKLREQLGAEGLNGGLERALEELEHRRRGQPYGWIIREGTVVWIVDALESEPNMSPESGKHRIFVGKHVAKLDPDSAIVQRFWDHYNMWRPDPRRDVPSGPSPTNLYMGSRRGYETLSEHSDSDGDNDVHGDSDVDRAVETRGRTICATAENPANHIQSQPPLSPEREVNATVVQASDPPDPLTEVSIRGFFQRYYGDATRERKCDIVKQLRELVNGGTRHGGGTVRATSIAHLALKCRQVMARPVRKSDSAIVVLLTKVADVSKDSPTERARADSRAEDHADEQRMRQDMESFAAENSEAFAQLQAQASARYPGTDLPGQMLRNSWLYSQVLARRGRAAKHAKPPAESGATPATPHP